MVPCFLYTILWFNEFTYDPETVIKDTKYFFHSCNPYLFQVLGSHCIDSEINSSRSVSTNEFKSDFNMLMK